MLSTAGAIKDALGESRLPNQPENVVDAITNLASETQRIANAITPIGSHLCPGHDATDGAVGSLTEAVMGMTAGLVRIADAISELASAVERMKDA